MLHLPRVTYVVIMKLGLDLGTLGPSERLRANPEGFIFYSLIYSLGLYVLFFCSLNHKINLLKGNHGG